MGYFLAPHPLCTREMSSMGMLEEHFEKAHEFKNFLAFKLKPRSPPQTTITKRSRSRKADAPIAKRRCRKMSSDKWPNHLNDGFVHWRPLETLPTRPELAANDDTKIDSPSCASSPQWETLRNMNDKRSTNP